MSIVAAALAKLAAIGLPAKAAVAGLAVAVAAAGGVVAHAAEGATDPDGITDDVQELVDPDSDLEPEADAEQEADAELEADEPAAEEPGDGVPTLPEAASFGQSVAQDARDGGVIGLEIAERARVRAEERRADARDHSQAARERTRSELGAATPEPEPRGRPEVPAQRP